MLNRCMFVSTIVLGGLALPALGQLVLTGTAGAGWQAFPGALNNYGNATRPYWDQNTLDGNPENRNVGNYLNNTWTGGLPAGAAASPNIAPVWWGRTSITDFYATQDLDVRFSTGGTVGASLRLELSGNSGTNEIGWYNPSDVAGSETLNPIFVGGDSPITGVNFTPSNTFALYLRTVDNRIFFSDASRNREGATPMSADDRATQHFAFFGASLVAGNEVYYIGSEDLRRQNADREIIGDYNDLIFTIRAVPTPGAAALMGLGILAAGRRRR
ncbi:MAG: PEP-CTERM sorting domain-containing protein [Phycisphaerales bacterium]